MFGGKEHKMSSFADIVTLSVENPDKSLQFTLQLVQNFRTVTGHKVKSDTSEFVPVDERRDIGSHVPSVSEKKDEIYGSILDSKGVGTNSIL